MFTFATAEVSSDRSRGFGIAMLVRVAVGFVRVVIVGMPARVGGGGAGTGVNSRLTRGDVHVVASIVMRRTDVFDRSRDI